MSLIDDALKRAQEEAARQEEAHRLAQRPWIAPQPPKRRRNAAAIAAVSAAAVAALAVFLFIRPPATTRGGSPSISPARSASTSPIRTPLPAPRPASAAPPPAPRLDTVEVPPPVLPAVPEKRIQASSTKTETPPLHGTNPEPNTASSAHGSPPAGHPRASAPLPDGKTFVRSAVLPGGETIDLDGIVFSETNPVAVIGGRVLAPGASVGDFEIVKIEENRVTLRGRGVTIFLTLS